MCKSEKREWANNTILFCLPLGGRWERGQGPWSSFADSLGDNFKKKITIWRKKKTFSFWNASDENSNKFSNGTRPHLNACPNPVMVDWSMECVDRRTLWEYAGHWESNCLKTSLHSLMLFFLKTFQFIVRTPLSPFSFSFSYFKLGTPGNQKGFF